MGDVWTIFGWLLGAGIVYTVILTVFGAKTEATPRPDLEEEAKK